MAILQEKYKIDFIIINSINPRTMTKFLKSSELTVIGLKLMLKEQLLED